MPFLFFFLTTVASSRYAVPFCPRGQNLWLIAGYRRCPASPSVGSHRSRRYRSSAHQFPSLTSSSAPCPTSAGRPCPDGPTSAESSLVAALPPTGDWRQRSVAATNKRWVYLLSFARSAAGSQLYLLVDGQNIRKSLDEVFSAVSGYLHKTFIYM
jgi:hypothetical protein